jgi:hypothetical protein
MLAFLRYVVVELMEEWRKRNRRNVRALSSMYQIRQDLTWLTDRSIRRKRGDSASDCESSVELLRGYWPLLAKI